MDRRKEPRLAVSRKVSLTLLSFHAQQEEKRYEATILDVSGRGMSIEISVLLPSGSAVRIDIDQQVILGEVCHCHLDDTGTYIVGLECKQMMANKNQYQLFRSLMDETPRETGDRYTPSDR